ncbi:hypothetical protein [Zavarzinia sp. CC-PAN008]|uniref:hypothetical protein n=1 Tax=Zavarzinia sp. CC-PAN008 TaxID=3243332 RepID=UPI003F749378
MLGDLVDSGHVVDLILAVLVLEVLALGLWRRRLMAMLVAALPGACLLLALRCALTDAGWPWVALWLALSFPAHLLDLWRRPP